MVKLNISIKDLNTVITSVLNNAVDNSDEGVKDCETAYNSIKKQVEKQGYKMEEF